MDKLFEKQYEVEIPKLSLGENELEFAIDDTFFEHFEYGLIHRGTVQVHARITKYTTHLDAVFHFHGSVDLECDRCMEPYPFPIEVTRRVIYSYDDAEEYDTDEVLLIEREDPFLQLSGDFYDFISLEVPLRKVPAFTVHRCPDAVLEILGIDPITGMQKKQKATKAPKAETEDTTDPRWNALKKLQDEEEEKR